MRGLGQLSAIGSGVTSWQHGQSSSASKHIEGGACQAEAGDRSGGSASSVAHDSEGSTPADSAAGVYQSEFGSKISALAARFNELQCRGEKTIVFAQWQDLIFKIHAALTKRGIPAAVLAGSAFDRASILQDFEHSPLPVLLLSLEDSASGTNMTHASNVVLVHPMVAASKEEQHAYEAQAIGRVRRWGQQRRVQVWRMVMEGTVEMDLISIEH